MAVRKRRTLPKTKKKKQDDFAVKIDHGIERRDAVAEEEYNNINHKDYDTFMDLLDDTPDDKYIYLGAKKGSNWIFIASCANMKAYLAKVNEACSKKQDPSTEWINFEDRKVVDYYRRLSKDDDGICVIVEGHYSGRNWNMEEQVDHYRKDKVKEAKRRLEETEKSEQEKTIDAIVAGKKRKSEADYAEERKRMEEIRELERERKRKAKFNRLNAVFQGEGYGKRKSV